MLTLTVTLITRRLISVHGSGIPVAAVGETNDIPRPRNGPTGLWRSVSTGIRTIITDHGGIPVLAPNTTFS